MPSSTLLSPDSFILNVTRGNVGNAPYRTTRANGMLDPELSRYILGLVPGGGGGGEGGAAITVAPPLHRLYQYAVHGQCGGTLDATSWTLRRWSACAVVGVGRYFRHSILSIAALVVAFIVLGRLVPPRCVKRMTSPLCLFPLYMCSIYFQCLFGSVCMQCLFSYTQCHYLSLLKVGM